MHWEETYIHNGLLSSVKENVNRSYGEHCCLGCRTGLKRAKQGIKTQIWAISAHTGLLCIQVNYWVIREQRVIWFYLWFWVPNTWLTFNRYKIYIEGSAWSISQKYILACDSMTLLVTPKYYDFFSRSLMPIQHYWPVQDGDKCASIKYAVEWGNSHKQSVIWV
jgi:hypothetical protein